MSTGRNPLGKFGIIEAMKPEITSLALVLKLVQPSIRKARVGAAKRWSSESSGRESHRAELARRTLNESFVRSPVSR